MNISLTPRLEEHIRDRVASGLYNNASEVVREALRFFFERVERPTSQARGAVPAAKELLQQLASLKKPLREKGIASLSLFGSFATGKANLQSDIDVLVETLPRKSLSLIDLANVKNLLEERLGRTVDVVPKEGLDPYIRARVLEEARKVF